MAERESSARRAIDHLKMTARKAMWSYLPGKDTALEPSIWCAIACREDAELTEQFLENLLKMQNADGGWSSYRGAAQSDWITAVALLGLRILGANTRGGAAIDGSFKRGADFLMDNRTDYYKGLVKAIYLLWKGPQYRYSRGWPWTPGTFDWIEPTAYVLMALRQTSYANVTAVAAALNDAEQFLLQSYCYPGGWDYADRTAPALKASESRTGPHQPWPYPWNTAVALLALQNNAGNPVVESGLDFLSKETEDRSPLALAWSSIALNAFARDTAHSIDRLIALQRADGSFSADMMTNALSTICLTMGSAGNPLKSSEPRTSSK